MVTNMLKKAIEIEGLLRIIRDGNPLPETYIMLSAKTEELAEDAILLEEEAKLQLADKKNTADSEPEEKPDGDGSTKLPATPMTEQEQQKDTDAAEPMQQKLEPATENAAQMESGAKDAVDLVADTKSEAKTKIEFEADAILNLGISLTENDDNDPEEDQDIEEDVLEDTDDDILLSLEEEEMEETVLKPAAQPEPKSIKEQPAQKESESDGKNEIEMETPVENNLLSDETQAATEKTVSETPTETKRKVKLKSIFSLNDRFLYSRELFEGNMKMFDSTLNFLEGIDEYSIIEDYFYSELEWDPEDRFVASFMDILRPHFKD